MMAGEVKPGDRFNLVVVKELMTMAEKVDRYGESAAKTYGRCWWGDCDCGTTRKAYVQRELRDDRVVSCGCVLRARNARRRAERKAKPNATPENRALALSSSVALGNLEAKKANKSYVQRRIAEIADEFRASQRST